MTLCKVRHMSQCSIEKHFTNTVVTDCPPLSTAAPVFLQKHANKCTAACSSLQFVSLTPLPWPRLKWSLVAPDVNVIAKCNSVFMRWFQKAENNAYRITNVCPSSRPAHVYVLAKREGIWRDFIKVSATGGHTSLILRNVGESVAAKWQTSEHVSWKLH
jgi:hypothetical protein